MYKIPSTLTEEIHYFDGLIDEFHAGKIEPVKFKAIRVPMGIYEQRKDGSYMVRIRCTGGFITPAQLKQVALSAKASDTQLLHITTRQEIQIHHVKIDDAKHILPELQFVGLSTKGGGGNTVRNILVDVDSGISNSETFDVFPYASDLTSKLIAENDSFTLPRKFKMAFASNENEPDLTLVNDLGFVAKIKDGKRGFKVYFGGSVASNPTVGWQLFDFAPVEDLYYIASAAKELFSNYGNRKNRHKARIRYIFFKLGKEKVFELFFEIYNRLKQDESLHYIPTPLVFEYPKPELEAITDSSEAFQVWKSRYATEQRQAGKYSIVVPFDHGNVLGETITKIADFAANFGDDTIRFSVRQNLHLRNIPESWLGNLYQLLNVLRVETAAPVLLNNLVSCTGADTCRLGICLSKGASAALRRSLNKSGLNLDSLKEARINISGCPNSCAQQGWSDLGFSGKVNRNDRAYPAYRVFAGALRSDNNPALAETIGEISARDLPEFTVELIRLFLSKKEQYSSFQAYVQTDGKQDIVTLLERYREIPTFDDNKNYYYDWGSENAFSLAKRGQAECSAGLFDMIEIDLDLIRKLAPEIEVNQNPTHTSALLYDMLFSASRMLLITRGAEPRTTKEAFNLFIEKFIDAGLVDQKFRSIVQLAIENAKADFLSRKQEVIDLAQVVVSLYESMDDSLQFKNISNHEPVAKPKPHYADTTRAFKDFRGVACPLNFVKTKIELSALNTGDLLEILLDDGAPIQNVPGSIRSQGHEVLDTIQEGDYWKVFIRKGAVN